MAPKNDDFKPDAPKAAPDVAELVSRLQKRVNDLERRVGSHSDRGGATPDSGDTVGYQLDRLNAIAIKYHNGDLLDYDRNARFYRGEVVAGQPKNIGPPPPRRDGQPDPGPRDPRVTVRGDQVTPAGEAAGALDASNLPV